MLLILLQNDNLPNESDQIGADVGEASQPYIYLYNNYNEGEMDNQKVGWQGSEHRPSR